MRYILLFGALALVVLLGGCSDKVSATQPSPVLMIGERFAAGYATAALEHAYAKGDMTYPEYAAAATALKKLYDSAQANGGAITQKDIADAVGAGAFQIINQYLPPEPRVLPPS